MIGWQADGRSSDDLEAFSSWGWAPGRSGEPAGGVFSGLLVRPALEAAMGILEEEGVLRRRRLRQIILRREICIFPDDQRCWNGEGQARVMLEVTEKKKKKEVTERPVSARCEEDLYEWGSSLKTQRATLREGASCPERFQKGWSSYF